MLAPALATLYMKQHCDTIKPVQTLCSTQLPAAPVLRQGCPSGGIARKLWGRDRNHDRELTLG